MEERPVYRLIYVASSSLEVADRYQTRLLRLRDAGFEVHVLAGDDGGLPALAAQGVIVRPLPIAGRYNLPGAVAAYFICQAYFLDHSPALVHAFGHRAAASAVFAAHQAQTAAIFVTIEEHWAGGEEASSKFRRAIRSAARRGYRALATMVDRYIVDDEERCRWIEENGIAAAPKVAWIESEDELLELYDSVLKQALELD